MPVQNVPPAPVSTAQRTSSSPSIMAQASAMPTSMAGLSAFFASGRSMVTTTVAPRRSTLRCSVPVTVRVEHISVLPLNRGGPGFAASGQNVF